MDTNQPSSPAEKSPGNASTAQEANSTEPQVTSQAVELNASNEPIFQPNRDFYLAFMAMCVVTLTISLDATSLSVALPTVSTALDGTALEAFWSGTSFLLASTVLQPSVASMSNILGRKWCIYITGLLFGAGSLLSALAGTFTIVLAGRTLQGMGGGGLIALTEVVVTDLVPLAQRGQWFSVLSAMWSIGTVTGPLIGAGFAQDVTWRWIFYINLPILGVGMVFVFLFLHQAKVPGGIGEKLKQFDWIGSVLFTAATTAFLFGLSTGGVMHPWRSWEVLLPLLIGLVGMGGFGYWEVKVAGKFSVPIIDRRIFNNWDMVVSYLTTVFHGAILWSLLYFLTLYYQGVKHFTPINSAVALLPETLTVAPAGVAVGIIAGITGHYRWSIWGGWILCTFGAGLLLLLKPETTIPQWIFLNLPIGLGAGMLYPAMALAIQAACVPGLNGQAAAFFSFIRGLGQSVGVAISGVVFQNVFRRKLLEIPRFKDVADAYSRDATIVVGVINGMPEGVERRELVRAYCDALKIIWVTLLAFAAASMVLGFTVKGYTLKQRHVTDQGLVGRDGLRKEKEDVQQKVVAAVA